MIEFINRSGAENRRVPGLGLDKVISEPIDEQGVAKKNIESQNNVAFLERIIRELKPASRIPKIRLYDSLQLIEIGDSGKFPGQQFVQIKFGGNLQQMLFAADFKNEFVHQRRNQKESPVRKRAGHLTTGSSPFLHNKIKFARTLRFQLVMGSPQ